MTPKDNFINAKPSIITNNEPERADNLSTTDQELEAVKEKITNSEGKADQVVNRVNDAGVKEIFDIGMDEEA